MSIDDLLDRPAPEGARLRALELLDAARAARPRLDDPTDVDAVHDFRVALRRLRSLLKAHKPLLGRKVERLRRELGEVSAATGQARDAEVQIAWLEEQRAKLIPSHRAALAWLLARLEEKKAAGYTDARTHAGPAFDALEPRVRRRLARYRIDLLAESTGPTLAAETARLVDEQAAALVEGLKGVTSATDEQSAHEARIVGKQLRYLLEPLADSERVGDAARTAVKALKALQDLLGQLHDTHVLGHVVAQALIDSAAERARQIGSAVFEGREDKPERDLRPGLTALAALVRDLRDALYRAIVRRRRSLGELTKIVAVVGEKLRAGRGAGIGTEIERKYLLADLPPVDGATVLDIEQGYLPGERLVERLRRTLRPDGTVRLARTVKLGAGLRRLEVEEECPVELFRRLWPLTAGNRVRKRRYQLTDGDLTWEIDQFLDRDLVLAEVELPTEDTPVPVPDWLSDRIVRDVTGEHEFTNEALANATPMPPALTNRTTKSRPRSRSVAKHSPR